MKQFIFLIAVIVFASFIGCQQKQQLATETTPNEFVGYWYADY